MKHRLATGSGKDESGRFERRVEAWSARVVADLDSCRECPASGPFRQGLPPVSPAAVQRILRDFMAVLFPGCHGEEQRGAWNEGFALTMRLRQAALTLAEQAQRALRYQCQFERCRRCGRCRRQAEQAVTRLLEQLPAIHRTLQRDILAAYEGDPAARSTMEVVMSYPGFYAVVVHRLAHVLYTERVPLIPRMMSEHAHAVTGIDIHPGALIGEGFFIDHGTGVVIGETCKIGRHVKLYQGVTLGALSFEKDAQGRLIKGIKRHPNVEDHVVIYAGATILGGQTTIGAHSIIGGNVWLTHSVPPYSIVYNQQPQPLIRRRRSAGAEPVHEPSGMPRKETVRSRRP